MEIGRNSIVKFDQVEEFVIQDTIVDGDIYMNIRLFVTEIRTCGLLFAYRASSWGRSIFGYVVACLYRVLVVCILPSQSMR